MLTSEFRPIASRKHNAWIGRVAIRAVGGDSVGEGATLHLEPAVMVILDVSFELEDHDR